MSSTAQPTTTASPVATPLCLVKMSRPAAQVGAGFGYQVPGIGRARFFGLRALALMALASVHGTFLVQKVDGEATTADRDVAQEVHFETDVRPIFKAMCFHCHGEMDHAEGGLDLRLVRLMLTGGDSGAALEEDYGADDSLLWWRIESDEMPEGPKKLSADQKETIRRWIDAGFPTLRPEPEDVADAQYTPEELAHWSFQAPTRPDVPLTDAVDSGDRVATEPIDAFVLRQLGEVGLSMSPEADRATLLRRVTFDLTGLPPTTQELDAFLSDSSPEAYETVVDRLLKSPDFGVRWGRHWLDVAGFSETEGHLGWDTARPHAWRYRDYVINAVNSDKAYDAFIHEQLAGDEIVAELTGGDGPDPDNDRHVELMTATGFLQMAPDLTSRSENITDRNQAVAETIKVVSSSILGLTVGCAQCHDHRYDPISAADYYSLRAVFDPVFPLENWKEPEERLVNLTPSDDQAEIDRIEAIAVAKEENIERQKLKIGRRLYQKLIAELTPEVREKLVPLLDKDEDDLSEAEQELRDANPMVRSAQSIADELSVYDPKAHEKFFQREKTIQELRDSGPAKRMVMCVRETDQELPDSTVMVRGDPLSLGQSVTPAELFVLARQRTFDPFSVDRGDNGVTGRRLAYARQLTDGSHPTVARVAVNRIWAHHFGQGLSPTVSDFGLNGEAPSHPGLLDWLAHDFVAGGWRTKRLHRAIVLSRTYR